jgi:hypothetical protein
MEMEGFILLVAAVLVLDLLAARFGADSRDGEDWIRHRRI